MVQISPDTKKNRNLFAVRCIQTVNLHAFRELFKDAGLILVPPEAKPPLDLAHIPVQLLREPGQVLLVGGLRLNNREQWTR